MQIRFNLAPLASLLPQAGMLTCLALAGCAFEQATLDEGETTESRKDELSLDPRYEFDISIAELHPELKPIRRLCGVHLASRPGAFEFDNGTSQQWETRGMFDGDTSTQLSVYGASPATFWDRTNAFAGLGADPVDGRGSVVAPLLGGAPFTASNWVRFDFISPDVSTLNGWQGRNSFSYSILEAAWYGVSAQLVLEVVKCDGSTAFFREVNAAGNAVFCPLQHGTWTTCNTTISLSNVDYLKRLHVRVFGPEASLYEGGIYLDRVRAL